MGTTPKPERAKRRPAITGSSQMKPPIGPKPTIWRDFFTGLLLIFALLAVKWYVEARTAFGEQVELMGYNLIQHSLSSRSSSCGDMPIQIVDIGKFKKAPVGSRKDWATPREPLYKLIEAIAKQHPQAIGVDIDFSPDEQGYKDPVNDPGFFRSIVELRQNTGVPIFLGIWRTAGRPREMWLGSEEFKNIAACILVPRHDTRKMVSQIVDRGATLGPTLCSVMAGAVRKRASPKRPLTAWLLEPTAMEKASNEVSFEEFAVDYSPLSSLEHDTLGTVRPTSVEDEARRFAGKLVLLGDATWETADSGDTFIVPGRRREPCPGVYIHACAVYSLINSPLYELTPFGRVFLDALFSILVLGGVVSLKLYYRSRTVRPVASRRVQATFTGAAVVLVIVIGYRLVRFIGVIWDDFLLVAIVLLAHPAVARKAESVWKWARTKLPVHWRGWVFSGRREKRS